MQAFNKINSSKDIREALQRNKRMNMHSSYSSFKEIPKDNNAAFLEWDVFSHLEMNPMEFLSNLQTQFTAEQNFRDRRQRNVDFTRGRHFSELVFDPEVKKYVTQLEYLRRRNIPPLTYNVISKLVRSLTGQFREINTGNVVKSDSQDDRAVEIATILTKCVERIKINNKSKSKDAMNFKEALQSGRPVFKMKWGSKRNMGKDDVLFRLVNPANFMTNAGIVDYDLDNLHTIMEIHDTSIDDIITNCANGEYDRGVEIRRAYINYRGNTRKTGAYNSQSWDGNQIRNASFQFHTSVNSSDRYYEIWSLVSDYEAITFDPLDGIGTNTIHKWRDAKKVKKEIEEENARRRENSKGIDPSEDILIRFKANFVSRWFVTFLTPFGMVLDVRESPYKSGLSPFIFPPPDINGEIWGLVEEVIPAQLSLDRQIAQADAIIANASKGVWLVPDTAVPDTHTQKEYLTELRKSDGAVIYKIRDGAEEYIPKQVYANSANVSSNVQQLIQMYSGLVDDISGNYGAAQGKESSNNTATGYALESQNAGLNIRDTIENYLSVLLDRDDLILQFVLEGYTKSDYYRVTGKELNPNEIKDFEFRLEQSKGTNSPAHRLALEQELLQLVYNQLLPFDVFLEVSNNPVMIQAKQKYDEWKKTQQAQQEQMAAEQQAAGGQQPADISGGAMPQGTQQAMSMDGQPMAQELGVSPMGGGGKPSISQIQSKIKSNA